mmetsp:Transcript_1900/g.7569  ORF Transcript_1900/g.7569 Transcript_1900/m.7569 type:complete len:267 (-) Transcript_1900:531-1331(-)
MRGESSEGRTPRAPRDAVLVPPLDEQLSDFDPFAAGAQRVLHRLARADDGDAADLLREAHAVVRVAVRRAHGLVLERQMAERVLDDEPDEPVAVEDEIASVTPRAPYDGVHASDLEIRRQHDEVGVDPPQVVLTELRAYVLHDEVDGDGVLPLRPGDDHVRVLLARRHERVEHRLHERRVLRDHAIHRSAAVHGVSFQSSGQTQVVVRVDEDFHVAQVPDFLHRQHQDALDDDHVRGFDRDGLLDARVRDEIVNRHLHRVSQQKRL